MSFFKSLHGSIAASTAIIFSTLGLAAVGAVDYANAVSAKSIAQQSLDAAVLACAIDGGECDSESLRNILSLRGVDYNGDPDIDIAYANETGIATGTLDFEINSIILGGVGVLIGGDGNPFSDIGVRSAAIGLLDADGEGGKPNVNLDGHEITLVLDASRSMRQELSNLKRDGAEFVDRLYDFGDPKVSILPFGAVVRFPTGRGFEDFLDSSECPIGTNCPNTAAWDGCFRFETMDQIAAVKPAEPYSIGWYGDIIYNVKGRPRTCPPAGNEALFFSTDREVVKSKIAGLETSLGTGTERSLNWAYRAALSDTDSPYRNGVASDQKSKTIVLFSDGKPVGIGDEDPGNPRKKDPEKLASTLHTVCDAVNADPSINLYVIYYDTGLGNDGSDGAEIMERCAVDAGNFWLSYEGNLSSRFDQIKSLILKGALEEDLTVARLARLIPFPEG